MAEQSDNVKSESRAYLLAWQRQGSALTDFERWIARPQEPVAAHDPSLVSGQGYHNAESVARCGGGSEARRALLVVIDIDGNRRIPLRPRPVRDGPLW